MLFFSPLFSGFGWVGVNSGLVTGGCRGRGQSSQTRSTETSASVQDPDQKTCSVDFSNPQV